MRVLMFGWEFPPYSMGGLGTACYGLTKGLNKNKVSVLFVIPKAELTSNADYVKLLSASNIEIDETKLKLKQINSLIQPYMTSESYSHVKKTKKNEACGAIYGKDLMMEVQLYAERIKQLALEDNFDIIHAHDWLTYPAGINAKRLSGKKLIVHIHATEFDRSGGSGVNQEVYEIEKKGFETADLIMAVSNWTKSMIIKHYGINPNKIKVLHNAIDFDFKKTKPFIVKPSEKVVLFLGRITLQKGPDYFIDAAKKVLEKDSNVKFIIAGSGDMEAQVIEKVARLGLGDKILFTGYLKGKNIDKAYRMADVYVMPSVSEPFGLTPLESLRSGTPVIISKQSGISEVLQNALKIDFWDINQLANKILAVLKYRALHNDLTKHGRKELKKFSWIKQAKMCKNLYEEVLSW